MALTERDRRNIFNSLEEAIGTDDATNPMELLPTTPADHLVTREDMHANTAVLRGEMAELRAELRSEMTELRSDMAELRADMASGFATAKVETQQLIVAGMAANAIAVIAALLA